MFAWKCLAASAWKNTHRYRLTRKLIISMNKLNDGTEPLICAAPIKILQVSNKPLG